MALAAAALVTTATVPRAAAFDLAVTVDDLPWVGGRAPGDTRESATARLLEALRAHGVTATAFVVCDRVRRDDRILPAWRAAGHGLGNHTAAHPHIDDLSPGAWRRGVERCQERLTTLTGAPPVWFRYPYLQTGRTPERRDAARQALTALGLRPAPVTIDSSEWALHEPYVAARKAGDAARADAIGAAWVEHVLAMTRHYRAVARARTGGETAHVLLLHANATAADHLDRLLTALAAEGARFVTLEQALADPVFARPDDYAGPVGLSWLYRLAPEDSAAWAFDRGQWAALSRRFGRQPDDEPVRVDRDLVVRRLTERAWVVTHEEPWPANSLVAELATGALLLVGTPYTPEATERLLVWLRARFGPRELVAIGPHFHWDALGGSAALQAAGVPVYGSDATVRALVEREEPVRAVMLDWLQDRPALAERFRTLRAAPPDRVFPLAEGLHLRFGTDRVDVVFPGPSHAPDLVVVHLPDHDVLFGGCALLGGDRIGNRSDAAPLDVWAAAVRKLRDLPARHVIPGHGERTDRGLIEHTLKLLAAGR